MGILFEAVKAKLVAMKGFVVTLVLSVLAGVKGLVLGAVEAFKEEWKK